MGPGCVLELWGRSDYRENDDVSGAGWQSESWGNRILWVAAIHVEGRSLTCCWLMGLLPEQGNSTSIGDRA